MDRSDAARKWRALGNMTEARGCTAEEADTAATLRAELGRLWELGAADDVAPAAAPGAAPAGCGMEEEIYEARRRAAREAWERRERRAAASWNWEYRKCGKGGCWCAGAAAGRGHGPYKYGKIRRGRTVSSVYKGR